MRLKLRRLQQHLEHTLSDQYPDGVEIICPDGILSLSDDINTGYSYGYEPENLESRTSKNAKPAPDTTTNMNFRGWWKELDIVGRYKSLHRSLEMLCAMLWANPVDGIIGFSQGAALATMLTALCEGGPERIQALANQGDPIDILPPQAPFKFALLSCGYRGTDEFYDGFYSPRLTTPTFFDIATFDHMVGPCLSESWVQVSQTSRISTRKGGHWFPTSEADLRDMASFATQSVIDYNNSANASRFASDSLFAGRTGAGHVVVRKDSACELRPTAILKPCPNTSSSQRSRRVVRIRKKGTRSFFR